MESEIFCETCKGSGWNQNIKDNPVDITMPLPKRLNKVNLDTMKAYMIKRLCCSDCAGTGKRKA